MSPTIQFKRGAFNVLPASLKAGEPAFTTDKSDLFIGSADGSNRFFGSHRYWTRENGTNALQLKLVDKLGTNSVNLRAPADLAGSVTYTFPATADDGKFLKVDSSGGLSWASVSANASFTNATLTDTTLSGITTISNSLNITGFSTFSNIIDANGGLDVTGGSTFDNINVTGVGTIATVDINGGNIDGTAIGSTIAASGSFTTLTYNSGSTSGISTVGALFIGSEKIISTEIGGTQLSGIDLIDATTKATLEASLALSPNNFDDINVSGIATFQQLANFGGGLSVNTGIATFSNLIDGNGGLDITGQTTLNTGLHVTSGVSTFFGLVEADGGIDVTGHSELDGVNVSGATTVTSFNATGNATLGSDGTDTLTVNATSTFNGGATFLGTLTGTISTATRATQVDTTETTSAGTYYIPFVTNSTSTPSETIRVDSGISYDPSIDTLGVGTVRTTKISYSDGTPSITIDSVGNVGVATNLTIEGNLNVKGTTTTINTTELKVEDTLIDLGLQNSGGSLIPPTTTTVTEVGTVLNYYTGSSAKKAAFYWDHTNTRVAVAASVTESAGVLTVVDWGTMASGSILMNGKLTVNDCAGSTDVITCSNSERFLDNITIDGGTFV